jgi:hypothetical protein
MKQDTAAVKSNCHDIISASCAMCQAADPPTGLSKMLSGATASLTMAATHFSVRENPNTVLATLLVCPTGKSVTCWHSRATCHQTFDGVLQSNKESCCGRRQRVYALLPSAYTCAGCTKDLCWALKASSASSKLLAGTASYKGTDRSAADCTGSVICCQQ